MPVIEFGFRIQLFMIKKIANMEHVFISYSRRDTDFVTLLVNELRDNSHDVWMDTTDIRGGTEWANEIENAIDNCYAVIVITSVNSNKSEWVGREIQMAKTRGKKRKIPIIPLKIDKENVPRQLAHRQTIDFSSMFEGSQVSAIHDYRNGIRLLIEALERARPMLRFLRDLKHTNGEIREAAARKLGNLGDFGAAVPLINSLKDLDSDVRYEAALSLGRLNVRSAYKPLVRLLLEDDNPDVTAAAATALGQLGRVDAIGPLTKKLVDPDRFVRASVVRALGNLKNVSAVNKLVELLRTDGISDVREAAREALENIGGREAGRALRRIAESDSLGRKKA